MHVILNAIPTVLAPLAALAVMGLAAQNPADHFALNGMVVVKAVDALRVVVAIDTVNEGRPADGLVDHVFLFTAAASLKLQVPEVPSRGHLEYSDNDLVVIQDNARRILEFVVRHDVTTLPVRRSGALRFDTAIGLSHYTGRSDLRLKDLEHVQPVSGNPSEYQAGRHRLLFPA